MALQAENNNSNFLVEENGDIATIRSKENSDSQVSFYLFDDDIIDKLSEFNANKDKDLSAEEILNTYGLDVPIYKTISVVNG